MHQRQPAHKQVSALRYYSMKGKMPFTRMWGGEGERGRKKGIMQNSKRQKEIYFKKHYKSAQGREVFCNWWLFSPTLPKGLSAQLPLTMYRCECTSEMLFMVICNTFTYGNCNCTTPCMVDCTWGGGGHKSWSGLPKPQVILLVFPQLPENS